MSIELKLLSGNPISIENVGLLYPITLGQIAKIGQSQYNSLLSMLLFNRDNIVIDGQTIKPFDLMIAYCFHDENYKKNLIQAFKLFFKAELNVSEEGFFYFDDIDSGKHITCEVMAQIRDMLMKQNFIKESEHENSQHHQSDTTKEWLEKMNKVKQQIQEKNQEEGLNLADIISIVSAYSNVDLIDIWNLTVYQLYTLYLRVLLKDSYESQFSMMLQGADIDSSTVKHWASKLEL